MRTVLVANLLLQIAIVGTGGAVRLTASGLGCSTWPQCEPGSFVPQLHDATTYHVFVEFGNRLMTFVLTAAAVAVVYVVWGDRDRVRSYRLLGWVPIAGVVAQAVIGGVLVLLELPQSSYRCTSSCRWHWSRARSCCCTGTTRVTDPRWSSSTRPPGSWRTWWRCSWPSCSCSGR
ncbi:COX15/CtaA family protein [Cellulomonas sp.]|uniref:COX15/CtaA family protein n=1 Tax=Cellulomonas sp. TaxID=40001 RepID=UPI002587A069|nr:COX15/CtaA family protein [Cellulomonas sp.]